MAIVFPASPNINETFTEGSITYKCVGTDPIKWIGLGVTPADRLVEGSNKLEIDASNNLVYSGGNFAVGTSTANNTLTLYGDSSSSLRISKSGVLAYDHTFDGNTYTIANNNGSSGIDIVFGTKTAGGESLRINASGQLITKGRIFINNTNGGFDYNTTADTLEVLTTNGGTHSEFNSGAFVPSGSKNLGASGSRWNTVYANTFNVATGIDFSSTGNTGGMQSEILDDYEEGIWTPTLIGSSSDPSVTFSTQAGAYEKIGAFVHASFFMAVSGVSSQGSGQLRIGSLPFNSSSNINAAEVPAVLLQSEPFTDGDGSDRSQFARTASNANYMLCGYRELTTGNCPVPANGAANVGTGYFIGHITYRTLA